MLSVRAIVLMGVILKMTVLIPSAISMVIDNQPLESLIGDKVGPDLRFPSSVGADDAMIHLRALQSIADGAGGNRAVRTVGFNRTLDYITSYLSANTNFKVTTTFFYLRNFQLARNPTLSSSINSAGKTHTYSLSGDFYHVQYSSSANLGNDVPLVAIPVLGCSDADWLGASSSPAGKIALVKRGDCTFEMKAAIAIKYKVAALLMYNDGTAPDRFQPIQVNIGQHNPVPALFLSYTLGQALVNAANDPLQTATVSLTIALVNDALNPVGNICADTPTGDPTQTIVIGSHSDSVPAGPGINDNGSGSSTNLALATALARLLQSSSYEPYKYRVRFCWWGAEELGLLGAAYHASQAKISTVVGERITDYLVNINLDMVGSPNFIFGIYDGKTASSTTPAQAIPGSIKVTTMFVDWFTSNNLPRDFTRFDGRSDYGPFLAAGVCAGGLFTGADAVKTKEQRDRYELALGAGNGGTTGTILDPCYHRACDTINNINTLALDKMVKASAYAIETLARQDDLQSWLYPAREIAQTRTKVPPKYEYNSINEYFGLPYD